MSESYDKTLSAFSRGDVDAARREFSLKFVPATESFYQETKNSCPEKYAQCFDWGAWIQEYYRLVKKTQAGFDGEDLASVAQLLWEMRLHVSELNLETSNQTGNDYLTILLQKVTSGEASIEEIEECIVELNKAGLGVRARRQSYIYGKDKNEFVKAFNKAAADKELSEEEYNEINRLVSNLFFKYAAPFE